MSENRLYIIYAPAVIAEIRELNPALRVIYVLRNPIGRAWSSALMALERAELALDEASDQWFIDHFRSFGSLARGDYEACLRSWHGVFGEQADSGYCAQIPAAKLERRVFGGLAHSVRENLLPVLRQIYFPRIAALERYLGTDLRAWRDVA